jgi:hypothetical protein
MNEMGSIIWFSRFSTIVFGVIANDDQVKDNQTGRLVERADADDAHIGKRSGRHPHL